MRDEAEIRGHRSTYIGAMPGGIISAIKRAGVSDPVFLLDEIDKLGQGIHGDPASSLLEALDPEQNATFRDYFLDCPFPLTNVLFITTANTLETIPRPLLDRMEVIEIPSYTNIEKMEIAKRYLLPRQMKAHGLTVSSVKISEKTLAAILEGYTREAGVRELERTIGAVCRKSAVRLMETGRKSITVNEKILTDMLGQARFLNNHTEKDPQTGVVNGLAYTAVGGCTLQVECATAPGSGSLEITGNLGDVMRESAKAAMSFIRSHAKDLGLEPDFYKTIDIHVHVPEGAVPKDGPSAGVTLTCAIVSALTGRKARQDLAMTGEITLRGRVLPIGGVREKVLAAYRSGLSVVLLPEDNMRDLAEIPEQAKAGMDILPLRTVSDAINAVLA
jgi:ATP-dependent Lon protease